MASSGDQQQAVRLLKIHKRNLERLEVQKANLAGEINLAIENQIDEERANIAVLEPIANPPPLPSPKIQEFVKATTPGEIDLLMLYLQGTQLNQRMSEAEKQNAHIIDEQQRASVDRMLAKEDISTLMVQVARSEEKRSSGATWYRRAIVMSLSVAVLALIVGCAALAAALT